MACFFTENVHTKSFTPREFQVELLDSAKERNIIVCLNPGTNKTFIALKLIQELSNSTRISNSEKKKRTLYIGNEISVEYFGNIVKHLTDLNVGKHVQTSYFNDDDQVIAVTYEVCLRWLTEGKLDWRRVNVVVIEDCHFALCNHPLREIISNLKKVEKNRPKLLGLTSPLFSNCDVEPGCVEAQVKRLELDLLSKVDTASDIVSILRYSAHPHELIVVCENPSKDELIELLESEVQKVRLFLDDHRYDPFEIYDESFSDELKDIPDPKTQPNSILDDFIEILHSMGAWCADKAALVLAVHIEKLKVKTPYERHFLLLCLVSSLLFKIRAYCDEAFQGMTELEKIYKYSTPKVLRLIEIVRQFKPKKVAEEPKEPKIVENGVKKPEEPEINDKETSTDEKKLNCFICGKVNCSEEDKDCKETCSKNEKSENGLKETKNENHFQKNFRWRHKGRSYRSRRGGGNFTPRHFRTSNADDADSLCGVIFVQKRFTAKILFHLFSDLHKNDPDFSNIVTQYTVNKTADISLDPREAEIEHKKQEDVLKRFRMRECNLVVATSVLEEGIELPRCNLVIRYDPVSDYKSHAHCKGRARQQISYYVLLVENSLINSFLDHYSKLICTERVLLGRTMNHEPSDSDERDADQYNHCVQTYKPLDGDNVPKVDLSTAIALVNRYCAKLPSDTFTRLVPLWNTKEIMYNNILMYYTTVRLPINSPVKEDIMGHPMHTKVLARRIAALETSRVLHSRGELDDNLEPIGKEAFNSGFEEEDLTPTTWDPNSPRPGTTKSRQYYYKRIASCLNDCRPVAGAEANLYHIDMELTCPLPEEQNTRGRKLHPPELSPQGFGILTLKPIPKICPFPIFTRSGEVRVNLKLCSSSIVLTERNVETITAFLNFIFTSVLRLQKYLMSFDPEAAENSFFIVPTKKVGNMNEVDWEFLETIYSRRHESPHIIPEEERKSFTFDPSKYKDAVVMPWYRNQDQPQYFYVAEICNHLGPRSAFPGSDYSSFEDYYKKKYDIQIQNLAQPLLDVDHTSARLNFLTPRYVNRKGVALPTSSEETKRAKRENLEQKQILVAELCLIHVVPASLWRQAVCLPCILYRINALLLANEIRAMVAREIALGFIDLPEDFAWSPLDFGWSLADVLKKSKEQVAKKDEEDEGLGSNNSVSLVNDKKEGIKEETETEEEIKEEQIEKDEEDKEKKEDWMEIGTWSNEMAQLEGKLDLPDNLTMVRYGSPTSWEPGGNMTYDYYYSDAESDDSSDDFDLDSENSDDNSSQASTGLKITFQSDYIAEAVDDEEQLKRIAIANDQVGDDWNWNCDQLIDDLKDEILQEVKKFQEETDSIKSVCKKMIVSPDQSFIINRTDPKQNTNDKAQNKQLGYKVDSYGMPKDIIIEKTKPEYDDCSEIIEENNSDESEEEFNFSFDLQPDLNGHPGPSPSLLLQALTMSNANDGINLERLETIGDSFLKYAITTYLYCTHENIHEGKLSHLRSKQVSNLKLYRLGQKKVFGECMIASKFEPHDNWLPPCYLVPRDAEQELVNNEPVTSLPYNLVTQHSIPDKSIADCVEALIGAYLIECGPRGALMFMSWLGIKVLPREELKVEGDFTRPVGSYLPVEGVQVRFGSLETPKSPLLRHVDDPEGELSRLIRGFDSLEQKLKYTFNDKSFLLQAMTHTSYSPNRLTDCYQRLEFLGDAVLDYLITRHLYEDKRAHSPGSLTDLRSALVNNTIFASLAVKHGLHKYFRHLSPGLGEVIQRFVTIQEQTSHAISEEYYLVGDDAEDVEVPKALGDVFESVAGAIFLDSKMSLDTVWKVYFRMMKNEIEQFSTKVPKSPIRELLELEPETAKFSKPEKLADGRRVRVTVEVFGKGTYKGIGRNYRIAKCTAAKCALKQLKKKGLLARKLCYFNGYPFQ